MHLTEQTRSSVLVYGMDFHEYKLVPEVDENDQSDRNVDSEIKRKNTIQQELDYEYIRIDPDKDDCDILEAINKIFRHVKQSSNQLTKQSTKNTLIDKISMKVLALELISDNMIKPKALNLFLRKYILVSSEVV